MAGAGGATRASRSGKAKRRDARRVAASGPRHLPGLSDRGPRSREPASRLPVHQLHALRARMSIIRSLPYDRPGRAWRVSRCAGPAGGSTTTRSTAAFTRNPTAVRLRAPAGAVGRAGVRRGDTGPALEAAARAIEDGAVVAVLGLELPPGGGCLQPRTVGKAPRAQASAEKPFALLVRDLEQARTLCRVMNGGRTAACAEAPILLCPAGKAPPWTMRLLPVIPAGPDAARDALAPSLDAPPWPAGRGHQRQPQRGADLHEGHQALRRWRGRRPLPGPRPARGAPRGRQRGAPARRRADDPAPGRGYAPRPILLHAEVPCLLAVAAS